LVFQAPYTPRPLPGRGGNLQLNLPRLGGEGAAGSVVMQELRAAVWVPREYGIVGKPADFTPLTRTWINLVKGAVGYTEETTALDRWFGDASGGLFAFQTSGRAYQYTRLGEATHLVVPYWRIEFFTWCISGALFCAGVLLTRTSWNNRLSILLLGAFLLTLAALQDQELVLNFLAAGRFGFLAAFGWWVVHSIARPTPKRPVYRPGDPAAAVSLLAAVIPPPDELPKIKPVAPPPAAPN
ncbi:MAG: hypothetical protein NT069_18110, partial [Planctomycetota bacterium]|nr:hypothetical protein [Planctomycetota bacterium]